MVTILRKAWFGALPGLVLLAGCSFFSLEEPEGDDDDGGGATGGSGVSGSGGSGVSGSSGSGGSSAGTSPGGTAGTSAGSGGRSGGAGGTSAGSSGASGASGASGSAGSASGSAGSGGDAGSGAAGSGGAGGGGASGASGAGSGGSGGGAEPTTCEEWNPSAETFAEHCYLVNTTAVTWSRAREACMTLGGHLVTISSDGVGQAEFDAENAFVWGLVNNMEVWIGITDGKMDTEPGMAEVPFTWITGEGIAIDAWSDGEPNNYQKECAGGGGTCYEHCGFIPSDRNGQWNDEICGFEKPYVCERELSP